MQIPEFRQYYATENDMNPAQLTFYKDVKQNLANGKFIDVNGNISYVFAYILELLANWKKKGFENLSDFLFHLSELYYHESHLSNYCKHWAHDCLLGLGKLDEFLVKLNRMKRLAF